jgi:hypothetical protein
MGKANMRCDQIGDLEHALNLGCMVHFVRGTDARYEMRSFVLLGHLADFVPVLYFKITGDALF